MDLELTEDQKMIQRTIRDLVRSEFPKEDLVLQDAGGPSSSDAWGKLVSTGILGNLIPEAYGGIGGSFGDLAVMFEELGAGPVSAPHFSSGVLAPLLILEIGTEEQKRSLLPEIANGDRVMAIAITDLEYGWTSDLVSTQALPDGNDFVLTGTKLNIHDAGAAGSLLVCARLNPRMVGVFIVETTDPDVQIRHMPGFSSGLYEVKLNNVKIPRARLLGGQERDVWVEIATALNRSAPLLCAFQVGGSRRVFEMSLAYSNTRRQFGQVIGKFQRVQDHIIDMVNHLDAARWATNEAIWKLDTGRSADASIHMAMALASEGYYAICNAAHDVHAGVGIIREYGLTLHTKMSRTLYHYLGDPDFHKSRLSEALDF